MSTNWQLLALAAGVVAGSAGPPERAGAAVMRAAPGSAAAIRVRSFEIAEPIARARRAATVAAVVENPGERPAQVRVRLLLPQGVSLRRSRVPASARIADAQEARFVWEVEAARPGDYELRVEASAADSGTATAAMTVRFLPAVPIRKRAYIPEPAPVQTSLLIGAHNCPLWESDKPYMWANVLKHPERTPALGFYSQENPEVADWETKWAVEHGVSFFIYCWYRASQGEPVKQNFGSAIHQGLMKSRFRDRMKFTIMWENQSRGTAGVADERDLMVNLLPFWIDTYFKDPGYLKVDGKPVLFIYRPEFLVDDLGGIDNVRRAFDKMRQACRDAGFSGLTLLGEYRGLDPKHLALMKQLGLDYTFAYCWYVPNNPTPEQSIAAQMDYIRKTQALNVLPQVVTVSQAWSGWNDEGTIWKIPPRQFQDLLGQAKEFVSSLPSDQLGSRMLLLDNWNEWGEGHYIAPYREYGFGYLDAVRNVFGRAPAPHTDLIPEDIGRGPYDGAYRAYRKREEDLRKLAPRKVLKAGAPEAGLVGWWAFDEEPEDRVAYDYSGGRRGGEVLDARRVPGIDGSALACDGGCVLVGNSPALSPESGLSISCWVKPSSAGQGNNWFVNRVFSGGTATGYRMGVLDDRPCFEVPLTDWSHHLTADAALPVGRWTHLVGTFDGHTMRLYVDGEERATMERPGPVRPNDFHLCLGNFEQGHKAYFRGLLDEVRLYSRALGADEVRAQYRQWADRAAR